MKATAKDLRFHAKELLDTVARGEEVIITLRGKPHAKLVPVNSDKTTKSKSQNKLFGIWKDNKATANIDEYIRNIRKGRF